MKSQMDKLYEETDESLENQFRQKALNDLVLRYITGRTVFEVGCGSGTLIKNLLAKGYQASGCDVSSIQYDLAKDRLKKAKLASDVIYKVSLEDTVNWKRTFDTVICLDVLEHIKDDRKAIKLLTRLVKKRGRLIILVPANPLLWTERDMKYGHHRRYTKETLKQLVVNDKSVKITSLRYWNSIGAIITWLLIKLNINVDTDRTISRKNILIFSINKLLGFWLQNVEKYNIFPFGLSIFCVLEKKIYKH